MQYEIRVLILCTTRWQLHFLALPCHCSNIIVMGITPINILTVVCGFVTMCTGNDVNKRVLLHSDVDIVNVRSQVGDFVGVDGVGDRVGVVGGLVG